MKNNKDKKEKIYKPVSVWFFIVFWLVVIALGFIFFGKDLGLGLIVAAVLSGVIWYATVNSSYKGVIERFEVKSYRDNDNILREQKRAVLKLENGRTKKIVPMPDWKVGDKIEKRKGETAPRHTK